MRVRFAPSPTGFLHIGNARTAIMNYCIAKKYNAEYVLRIEDTDMERSTKESEISILADLKWLGINWTEGPDIDKGHGPYRQSERFDIYAKYTEKLLAEKKAYHCYCTTEELDEMRADAESSGRNSTYNRKCLNLTPEQKAAHEKAGRKPTVRFHVPDGETIEIEDGIKGMVVFNSENIGGDFIIVRSDGTPIYNYIVVIDDLLMEITHVIRGEDHLSNTPKQIMIARALGMPLPLYAHLPLILGGDRKKLSKRHGITSVDLYRSEGYLPEALMNYIAVLGWEPEGGEILPFDDLVRQIDLDKLGKNPAVFDFVKLKWMNSNYIRNYDLDKLIELFRPYLQEGGIDISKYDAVWFKSVITLMRTYCELLKDITGVIKMFTEELPELEPDADEMLKTPEGKTAVKAAYELFQGEINETNFAADSVNKVKEKTGLKGKNLFMPCRAILTASLHGPDLAEALKLIGFDRAKKRVEHMYKKYAE